MRPAARQIIMSKTRGLNKWRTARARGNPKLLMVGDSTTVGVGSQGDLHTNNRAGSCPTHLATILNAQGVSARCDWFIGDGNSGANLASAEPRLTLGLLTTVDTQAGLGGFYLINTTTTLTNMLDWTTTVPCDRVQFMTLKGSTPRSFDVFCDDVSQVNIDLVNASTIFFAPTVTLPAAQASGVSRKISTRRVAGGIRINGIMPYLAGSNQIIIGNAGRGSVSAVTLSTAGTSGTVPISLPDTITNAAPDLTVIELGINDQSAGATPAAYKAAIQILITVAKVTGDVILCAPHPITEGSPAYASAYYRAVLRELVSENGLPPLIDYYDQFGSIAALTARGGLIDGVHPLSFIYYEKAQTLARAILR